MSAIYSSDHPFIKINIQLYNFHGLIIKQDTIVNLKPFNPFEIKVNFDVYF